MGDHGPTGPPLVLPLLMAACIGLTKTTAHVVMILTKQMRIEQS